MTRTFLFWEKVSTFCSIHVAAARNLQRYDRRHVRTSCSNSAAGSRKTARIATSTRKRRNLGHLLDNPAREQRFLEHVLQLFHRLLHRKSVEESALQELRHSRRSSDTSGFMVCCWTRVLRPRLGKLQLPGTARLRCLRSNNSKNTASPAASFRASVSVELQIRSLPEALSVLPVPVGCRTFHQPPPCRSCGGRLRDRDFIATLCCVGCRHHERRTIAAFSAIAEPWSPCSIMSTTRVLIQRKTRFACGHTRVRAAWSVVVVPCPLL